MKKNKIKSLTLSKMTIAEIKANRRSSLKGGSANSACNCATWDNCHLH